jgi:ketosteroid isomerase-like protein
MIARRALVTIRIAVAALALTACAPRAGQRADSAATDTTAARASSWAADSAAIVAALDSSRAGWNRADLGAFYAPYDDSAAFVFKGRPEDPPIRSLPNVRGMSAELFKAKSNPPISEEPLLIKPLGPDEALTVMRGTMKIGGREQSLLATRVWRRTPAGWRVVADHTS